MARIRTIKPDFYSSGKQLRLSIEAAFLLPCLWTHADDSGRIKDDELEIGSRCPRLYSSIPGLLTELSNGGWIVRYEVGGKRFLQIHDWEEHQKINHPTPSKIPPINQDVSNPTVQLLEDSCKSPAGKEGKGKERKGKDIDHDSPPVSENVSPSGETVSGGFLELRPNPPALKKTKAKKFPPGPAADLVAHFHRVFDLHAKSKTTIFWSKEIKASRAVLADNSVEELMALVHDYFPRTDPKYWGFNHFCSTKDKIKCMIVSETNPLEVKSEKDNEAGDEAGQKTEVEEARQGLQVSEAETLEPGEIGVLSDDGGYCDR